MELEIVLVLFSATFVKYGLNIKMGLIIDENAPMISKTDDEVYLVQHRVDVREPYHVFKSVHDLSNNVSVDVIVVFDRDWSDVVSVNSNKTFIIWNRRPSFTIPLKTTDKTSVDFLCTNCAVDPTRSTTSGIQSDNRKTRSTQTPYCLFETKPKSPFRLHASRLVVFPDLEAIGFSGLVSDDFDSPTVTAPTVVADLVVNKLRWKSVFILHENATEKEVAVLVDLLLKKKVLFVIYNIDAVNNINSLLQNIYSSTILTESEIKFVMLCRISCVKTVLNTANNFDCKRKTLLKMFSRWLVAWYDHTVDGSNWLEQSCANDLDNVAVVAFPEFSDDSSFTAFEETLHAGIIEHRAKTAGFMTNDSLNEFMTFFLKRESRRWNPVHYCKGYRIDTLLWTSSGRQFSTVGFATNHGDVIVKSELFPNTHYGYNKRKFLVSTLPYAPFVMKRMVNGTAVYEGMCHDLLKELARTLNFTYELTEPEDKKWGSWSGPNLTFNGMIGQLQREEVDIVASDISIQKEREMVMDFAFPYYYGDTSVIIKKPDPKAKKWRTLIDPFKWQVLVTIMSVLPVVSFIVFLLEKYNPYYNNTDNGAMAGNRLGTFIDAFWYMYGALLSQGGVHLPDSITGRTFVSCWWLFCIIIVGTYCGNLIAFLTVTKDKAPFDTLEEMVNMKGEYQWGLQAGTNWEVVFTTSTNPVFRAVGDAMMEFNKSDPSVMATDVNEQLAKVRKGGYGWIGDTVVIEVELATDCDLMMMKERFLPLKYAFGFPNNSPHTKIFSEQMISIHESGLLQVWKRRWWPKTNLCKSGLVTEAKAISIIDVQSAFYVALGGAILGLLAFIVEVIVAKIIHYRSRQK